jgi:hypothetical protein
MVPVGIGDLLKSVEAVTKPRSSANLQIEDLHESGSPVFLNGFWQRTKWIRSLPTGKARSSCNVFIGVCSLSVSERGLFLCRECHMIWSADLREIQIETFRRKKTDREAQDSA